MPLKDSESQDLAITDQKSQPETLISVARWDSRFLFKYRQNPLYLPPTKSEDTKLEEEFKFEDQLLKPGDKNLSQNEKGDLLFNDDLYMKDPDDPRSRLL